jgi:predicted helicase
LDDYVKFIRFAQWRVEKTGAGILAMITNHGYLDNPTFCEMRHALMTAFSDIYLIDLHGNVNKREVGPEGTKDENVFDIRQGVAIAIFVKTPGASASTPLMNHHDLWGSREAKYEWLQSNDTATTPWVRLSPQPPAFLFLPQDLTAQSEYEVAEPITTIMPLHSTGVKTHRDRLVFDQGERALLARIQRLRDLSVPDDAVAEELGVAIADRPGLADRRAALAADPHWDEHFARCLLRPFDLRAYYNHDVVVDRPRREVMDHMLVPGNLALVTTRQTRAPFAAFVARTPVIHKCITTYDTGYVLPLYLYPAAGQSTVARDQRIEDLKRLALGKGRADATTQRGISSVIVRLFPEAAYPRWPNYDPFLLARLEDRLALRFVPNASGDLAETFGPENVFDYIYAILHCPTYRARYAEFLKRGFPRIPFTSDKALFAALAGKGAELVALHLMESETLSAVSSQLTGAGDNRVERVHYNANEQRVYINKIQYFANVPTSVWGFHVGGYQVCEKWLKDRKGRPLTFDDQQHYQRITVALRETIRLMAEIDALIPEWPLP